MNATPTGLEQMRAMFAGQAPPAPIAALFDMAGASADHGTVTFTAVPGEKHYNPLGTVHGGFAATLLDSAMGCATHTVLPAGTGYTTVDLHITYVKAMTAATGQVTATGTVVSAGRRIVTSRAELTDAAGTLLAQGYSTCLVLPPKT